MKCVVPSQNVKVLAKAFHSLGKIGDDLFIEPHRNHLDFRTVNMAESAYASFTFSKSFFSSFSYTDQDNEEALRCKIAMKSLLVVFKSQHGERLIDWCQIRLDPNGTKVIFQLHYSYGCTKTHFLPILESETLQANYSKEDCQNRLSTSAKLLSATVKNFRTTEDEVTLCVMAQKLILKNHLENNLDSKKSLRTEICLYPAEFEAYNIGAPTSVTFCLRELRAVLLFAEFTGLPIHFHMDAAGKPVVFVVNNDDVYEANYVVSTLSESGVSQLVSQTSESSASTSSRGPVNSKKRVREHTVDKETFGNLVTAEKRVMETSDFQNRNNLPSNLENSLSHTVNMNTSGLSSLTQNAAHADVTRDSNITQPIVKSVFGRCFNTTFKKQSLPGSSTVLAYDSDGMQDSD